MKILNISILTLSLFCACSGQNYGELVDRLDAESFKNLEGLSIYFRSKGHSSNSEIYFINELQGKCSPYVIEVDKKKQAIIDINNDLVLKGCKENYLGEERIIQAIEDFLKLKVCLVQVDSSNNVYINPNRQEAPILLRKSISQAPADIDQFQHYKGNWYLREKD